MKRWKNTCLWLSILMVALVSGCATTGGTSLPVAEGTPDNARAPASAEMSYLNINVASSGATEEGRTVAAELERTVREKLAVNGLPVKEAQPDMLLSLSVDAAPFDQAGNYYIYQVRVQATGQTTATPVKDLGMTRFDVRSDRKLGKQEALLNAAEKLADDAEEWSMQMVDPARSGLLANDITIEVPWYRTRQAQSDYARNFVNRVSTLPGMVSCRLVSQDVANKTMVFRAVYFRDSFPSGLLNQLVSIDSLGITPRK